MKLILTIGLICGFFIVSYEANEDPPNLAAPKNFNVIGHFGTVYGTRKTYYTNVVTKVSLNRNPLKRVEEYLKQLITSGFRINSPRKLYQQWTTNS